MSYATARSQALPRRIADRYWKASLARDTRADGKFVLAVRSTHIYCRPSCPARRPLRRNVVFFRNGKEAEERGFRACLRCRPNEIAASVALVESAVRRFLTHEDAGLSLTKIAAELHTNSLALRRAFQQVMRLAPREVLEAARLSRFKSLLRSGKCIVDALYETGFSSSSRIYERSNAHLGMTPAAYQKGGTGMKINYAIANCSLGKVLVGATERGIAAVYLGDSENKLVQELKQEYPRAELSSGGAGFDHWVKEIVSRVEGQAPRTDLPLDLQATAFQRRVWNELQGIPRGTTRTYSQIARALGNPKSFRAVARACATNPVSIVVPCHRVIREDGTLAGYRWGLSRKESLLARERKNR
jgi:AraC family transcriptional regulator of adaptative response/methylated-DNA-[protein]-cysteine methyltransferase